MHWTNWTRVPVVGCFIFLTLSLLPQAGTLTFTSSYRGGSVYGVSGTTVTFTWSLLGDTGKVDWGIKKDNVNQITTLVLLDQTGMIPFSPPAPGAYVKRVNGTFNGDSSTAKAIFTLANITTNDEKIYGCQVTSSDFSVTLFDTVALVVAEGPKITLPAVPSVSYNEGSVVNISCEATGTPVPNVRWIHNGQVKSSGLRTAQLTFNKISRADAGMYTCKANNSVASEDKQLNLSVNYTASIKSVSSSVSKSWIGQTVTLTCVSDGVPTPTLFWYNPEGNKFSSLQAKENIVDVTMNSDQDFGVYNCTADNGFVPASDTLRLHQIKTPGSPIITSTTADIQATSLTIRWSPPAEDGGSPITAYKVGILQERNVTDPKGRSLGIGELQRNTNYTVMVSARNYVFKGNASHKNMKTKFEDAPEPVVITADVKDDEVTLKWKEPNKNGAVIMRYTIYKRIGNDEQWTMVDVINDISKREFVVRVEKGKQYEFVVTATNQYGESLKNKDRIKVVVIFGGTSKPVGIQTGSCADLHAAYNSVIILLLIIIIILSVALWRMQRPCPRCRQNVIPMDPIPVQEKDQAQSLSEGCEEEANEPTSDVTAVVGDYMPLHPSGRSWEISREQVNVSKVIGKGAFSQVAQATVRDMRGRQEKTVAVKMLKENAPDSDRKDLLSELELMKKMKPHPHVIKLIGCVTKNDPLFVLIEYVPFGDLLGYLRKSRGLNDTYYKDPDVKPKTNLTAEQLMKFAWQVADGMCYLSSKKIIHRDLAARNVLVGEGEKCKVTDFGTARNVQQDDIYTRKSRGRLPVKWTAYEALLYGVYTTQSDVWSYGILLYEILTIGGSPYPNINARDIAGKIQEGYRMPKPRHVDSKLFEIMLKCWEENPNDRSTFDELRKTMKDFWKKHKTYVNLSEYDNRLYENLGDLTAE